MWSQLASLASQVSETVAPMASEFRDALRESSDDEKEAIHDEVAKEEDEEEPRETPSAETDAPSRARDNWLSSVAGGVRELSEALREDAEGDDEIEILESERTHTTSSPAKWLNSFTGAASGIAGALRPEQLTDDHEEVSETNDSNNTIEPSEPSEEPTEKSKRVPPATSLWGVVSSVRGAFEEFQEALKEESDDEAIKTSNHDDGNSFTKNEEEEDSIIAQDEAELVVSMETTSPEHEEVATLRQDESIHGSEHFLQSDPYRQIDEPELVVQHEDNSDKVQSYEEHGRDWESMADISLNSSTLHQPHESSEAVADMSVLDKPEKVEEQMGMDAAESIFVAEMGSDANETEKLTSAAIADESLVVEPTTIVSVQSTEPNDSLQANSIAVAQALIEPAPELDRDDSVISTLNDPAVIKGSETKSMPSRPKRNRGGRRSSASKNASSQVLDKNNQEASVADANAIEEPSEVSVERQELPQIVEPAPEVLPSTEETVKVLSPVASPTDNGAARAKRNNRNKRNPPRVNTQQTDTPQGHATEILVQREIDETAKVGGANESEASHAGGSVVSQPMGEGIAIGPASGPDEQVVQSSPIQDDIALQKNSHSPANSEDKTHAEDQLANVRKELEERCSEVEHWRNAFKELEIAKSTEFAEHMQMVEKEKAQVRNLETMLEKMKIQFQQRDNEIRAELSSINTRLEQERNAKSEALKEISKLRDELSSMKSGADRLKETNRAIVERAAQNEAALEAEIKKLTSSLATKDEEINHSQVSFEQYTQDLRSEVEAAKAESEELRALLETAEQAHPKLDELQQLVETLEAENASLRATESSRVPAADLDRAIEEIAALKAELDRSESVKRHALQSLESEITALRSDLAAASATTDGSRSEVERLRKALVRTTDELEKSEANHRQKVASMRAEFAKANEEREKELAEASERREELFQENVRLRDQCSRLAEQVEVLTRRANEATSSASSGDVVSLENRIVSDLVFAFVKRGRESGDHGRREVVETMARMLGWTEKQREEILSSLNSNSLTEAPGSVMVRGLDLLLSTSSSSNATTPVKKKPVVTTEVAAKLLERESFEDVFLKQFLAQEASEPRPVKPANSLPATPLSSRAVSLSSPASSPRNEVLGPVNEKLEFSDEKSTTHAPNKETEAPSSDTSSFVQTETPSQGTVI